MSSSFDYTLCYKGDYQQRRRCHELCTLELCPLSLSYWDYRPSLAANGLFLAIFALSLILFFIQAAWSKRFLGFTVAMVSGCLLEVLGYAGRIWAYSQPFEEVCSPHSDYMLPFPSQIHTIHTDCSTRLECLPHSDHLPHHRPCLPRGRDLLLPLAHRAHLRR